MSWRKDFGDLWESPAVKWVVYSAFIAGLGYAFWVNYGHDIKRIAVGVLILAAGLAEETTWYFWVILIGALLWIRANRKNRQRQETIIALLAEIRDQLNSR